MTRLGLIVLAALLFGGFAVRADNLPPIRRVTVDPARPPEALRRPDDLVRMKRDAFDGLVARARDAAERARRGPRIVTAEYATRWEDGRFVGAARLVIQRTQHDPPYLRLQPFGGALLGPATLEGQPALLGEIPGIGLALVAEFVGRATLTFSWSLRSERRPEGHRLFVQLPAAPIAKLSVKLPPEHWLEFPGNRQLTPLLASKNPDNWHWQVALGSSDPTEVEALIRTTGDAGKTAVLLVRPASEHDVTPAGVSSRFEFDLEAIHGRWSRLEIEADPALEVIQAALMQPESRDISFEQRIVGGRTTYVLALPAGIQGRTLLEVRGRTGGGVLKPGAAWSPPWLRVRGVHAGRETIRVRTAPGLRLADWQFGDFQPLGPWQTGRQGSEVWDELRLTQTGLATGRPTPPVAQIQLSGDEVAVRQEAWWHISQDRPQFVLRSWWQVLSGRLGTLAMSLPAGWELEDVELSPSGFLRDRYQDALAPGNPLVIQLREPIDASVPVRVSLRLRPSGGPVALGQKVAVSTPHVAPLGARWVQTQFGITLERGSVLGQPLWTGTLRGVNVVDAPQITSGQLWSSVAAAPDFYVTYFGRVPDGVLELAPAPPRFEAQATTDVHVHPERHSVRYEVRLLPRTGAPERATLELESPPHDVQWRMVEGGVSVRAARRSGRGPVQQYELEFDRPATGPLVIRGEAVLPSGTPLAVPLLRCADDPGFAGRLVIHTHVGSEVRLEPAPGLTPCEPTAPDDPSAVCYRYGSSPGFVRFATGAGNPLPVVVAGGLMCNRVAADGTVHCTYRCLLRSPRLEAQTITLPSGAALITGAVGGEPISIASATEPLVVRPTAVESHLQLTFTMPNRSVGSVLGLRARMPSWSPEVVVQGCRTIWRLPEAWAPLSNQWVRLPGPRRLGAIWQDWPRWTEVIALGHKLTGAEPDWTSDWLPRASAEWQRRRADWGNRSLRQVLLALEDVIPEPRAPLVVDLAALGEAGIDLDDPLKPAGAGAPWELAGLTLVPCRDSLLLTTVQRLRKDEAVGSASAEWTYGRFLTETIAEGRDSSGRFALLEETIGMEDSGSAFLLASGPGATSWESLDGADGDCEVLCAPGGFVWMIGAGWGLGIAAAGRRFARTRSRRVTTAVLGGGAALIALLWLPEALLPIVWCQFLGLWAGMQRSQRALAAFPSSVRPGRAASSAVVASLALLAVLPLTHGEPQAETDKPHHTVYLLPSPTVQGAVDVLAPRELVTLLEAMVRNAGPAGPAFVLLAADYRGQVVDIDAFLDVSYDLHVLHGEEADVPLSLRNVRLISAHVDGSPATATPLPRGDGIVIRVTGRGRHRLLLRWATRVVGTGPEREIRCDVPPVTHSELHFDVAAPVRALRATGARGGQATRGLPRSQLLSAALGHTSELLISWRTDSQTDTSTRVREAYGWDLNAAHCRLHAYLEYEVVRGTVERLEFALPPALAVQSVELRSLNLLASPPLLADWQINGTRLALRLAAPVAGRFGVLLDLPLEINKATPLARVGPFFGPMGIAAAELFPAVSAGNRGTQPHLLELATPVPLAAERQDGVVGMLGDLTAELALPPERGWVEIPPGERATTWPAPLAPAGAPARLFRFPRTSAATAWARVRPAAAEFQTFLDLTLAVDALDVEVQADLRVQVQRGELVLLTLRMPSGLELLSVSGEQVLRYTQLEGRVQIWFRNPVQTETLVQLRGWMRTASEAGRSPRLALPRLEIVGSTPASARLSIRNRRGLDVQWEAQDGLQAQAGPFPDDTFGVWSATTADYTGQLRLRRRPRQSAPAAPAAAAKPAEHQAARAARVLRADYVLQCLGLNRAVCTARYVVLHGPAATLTLEPPVNARLLVAVMDGAPLTIQPDATPWRLALPGASGLRSVDVTWQADNPGNGPLAFAAPQPIGHSQAIPGDLSIRLTPGMAWTQPTGTVGRRAAVEHRLRRSETLVRGLEDLVNERAVVEARWDARLCAKLAAIVAEVDSVERSLYVLGATPTARVSQIRRALDQLGRSAGVDLRLPVSHDAEPNTQRGPGTPVSDAGRFVWIALDDTPGRIELPVEQANLAPQRQALWLSLFLAMIIVALLPVLRRDRHMDSLQRAWPEIAVLAGFAWWLVFPGWLIGLAILASGLGGRLVRSVRPFAVPQSHADRLAIPSTITPSGPLSAGKS